MRHADLLLSHLSLVAGLVVATLLLGHMLRQRRPTQSTVAWMLAIVLVPYVGIPLYLLLGTRKRGGTGRRRSTVLSAPDGDRSDSNRTTLEGLLRSFGIPAASGGNEFRLCGTGEQAYAALTELIDVAHASIRITLFILHPDEVGTEIIERLARRAREGVKVQLLLDGLGSFSTSARALSPLTEAGGRVAFFEPLLRLRMPRYGNLRNHRKVVVVDERIALAGGLNVAREYLGPQPDPARWRDLAFVIEGPAVAPLAELVRSDWAFATGEWTPRDPGPAREARVAEPGARIQIVPSGPDVPDDPLRAAILTALFSARARAWVVTPYFVPDDALVGALAVAARRGVDVRLLLPERSNHRLADLSRGQYLRDLARAGARVQLYTPTMVHAKALVVDETLAMIGSANFDMRSLYFDYEVMVLAHGGTPVRETADWIAALGQHTRSELPAPGRLRELGEGLARMTAPLL